MIKLVKLLNESMSDKDIANKLSQDLVSLLATNRPIFAFEYWKEKLDYTGAFTKQQIVDLVKYSYEEKGKVGINSLKQKVREEILNILKAKN